MFGKKKSKKLTYNKKTQKPVFRKSICTGETTAGFKDLSSGVYHDTMLIRNAADIREFMDTYGLDEVPETEY